MFVNKLDNLKVSALNVLMENIVIIKSYGAELKELLTNFKLSNLFPQMINNTGAEYRIDVNVFVYSLFTPCLSSVWEYHSRSNNLALHYD